VINSHGDLFENDGVARILAWTEGVTSDSSSARVWGVTNLVMSGTVTTFAITIDDDTLATGESTALHLTIYDSRGNPIVADSKIVVSADHGKLSPEIIVQDEPSGSWFDTHYTVYLINNLEPKDLPNSTRVTFKITDSPNSSAVMTSGVIQLIL
jgi:hypothetical protein